MYNFVNDHNLTSGRPFEVNTSEVRPKRRRYAPSPGVPSHLDVEPPPLFSWVPYGHRAPENRERKLIRALFRSWGAVYTCRGHWRTSLWALAFRGLALKLSSNSNKLPLEVF